MTAFQTDYIMSSVNHLLGLDTLALEGRWTDLSRLFWVYEEQPSVFPPYKQEGERVGWGGLGSRYSLFKIHVFQPWQYRGNKERGVWIVKFTSLFLDWVLFKINFPSCEQKFNFFPWLVQIFIKLMALKRANVCFPAVSNDKWHVTCVLLLVAMFEWIGMSFTMSSIL